MALFSAQTKMQNANKHNSRYRKDIDPKEVKEAYCLVQSIFLEPFGLKNGTRISSEHRIYYAWKSWSINLRISEGQAFYVLSVGRYVLPFVKCTAFRLCCLLPTMNGDRFFSQKSKKKRKGSRKKKNKGEGIERPFSVFLSPILICKTNLKYSETTRTPSGPSQVSA